MDQKISQLNQANTITDADVLPIVNSAETKKVTVNTLKTNIRTGLALTTYVDSQDALKVDKIAGKGLSTEDYTSTEKTKLGTIQSGAEVNVNADWNAVSGDAEILNKPTIPTATSELTNDGSDGSNPFITALDIPIYGQAGTLVRQVKNMTGATLTKGTVVYISGANGNKPLVSKALATTDALSSRTFGLLQSNISNNGLGYCVVIGDLSGLDTSSFTEGDQLYLSGTVAGEYTSTKILAPTHLVYVGKVTRSHPTQGQIEVGIQNGYELEEIHDVALSSVVNNDLLVYESSTDLWKNKSLSELKLQRIIFSDYAIVAHTGTTAETLIKSYLIPANSFSTNDMFSFICRLVKGTTLGTATLRVYVNTSASLSGANVIAVYTYAIATNTAVVERSHILSSTGMTGTSFTTSAITDRATSIQSANVISFDKTIDNYYIVSIQLSNATDSVSFNSTKLTN